MGSLKAYVRLTRIEHGFIAAIATIVGCALGARGWSLVSPMPAVLAAISTILVEIGLFAFNDLFNIEEDRINAPHRPLVTGEISTRHAATLGSVTLVIGAALATLLGYAPAIVCGTAIVTGMAYNVRLKKLGLPGNLVVALDTALPFLFGATVTGGFRVSELTSLFVTMAFISTLGREILKGMVDIEGDKRAGIKTLAVTRGLGHAALASALFLLIATLLSIVAIAFIKEDTKCILYALTVSLADFLFAYSSFTIILERTEEMAKHCRKLTLLAMGIGTLAFATAA